MESSLDEFLTALAGVVERFASRSPFLEGRQLTVDTRVPFCSDAFAGETTLGYLGVPDWASSWSVGVDQNIVGNCAHTTECG